MVSFGCNYSPQLISLLEDGVVNVDWIKLSRWEVFWDEYNVANQYRPILLHVLPNVASKVFDINIDEINRAINLCKPPHIALHFYASPDDWDGNRNVSDDEVILRLIHGIRFWKERLHVELLIENVPYYGFKGAFRCVTDPKMIRKICEEEGVGLLLDLAHLRVAAKHCNEDVLEYLNKMPLEYVPEKHYLRDMHLEMQDEDYSLLKKTLKLIN